MDHHKNFRIALLSGFMIAVLSFFIYGLTAQTLRYTALPNIASTFIIVFIACSIVDYAYDLKERRKNNGT